MRTFISGLFNAGPLARVSAFAALCAALLSPCALRADQSTQIVNGTTITIEVAASGTTPFTYQWRKNGNNISGATQSSLVLSNVSAADAGNYSVVVSNSAGSTTSDLAILTTAAVFAPAITSQPANQSVVIGDLASFSVVASGSSPLTYQWKRNGVNVSGATDSTYVIDSVNPGDFGNYTVVVSNSAGSAESNVAILTDSTIPPQFTNQLAGQTVVSGTTLNFSLTASGTAPITYQWRVNGVNVNNGGGVSGATTPTLTLTGVTPAFSAVYSVIATNGAGSVSSNNATLSVFDPPPPNTNQAPIILTQPTSQTVAVGETVVLGSGATGVPAPTLQWQKNGVDLVNVGGIQGATTANLTIFGAKLTDAGEYRLLATNALGTATSNAATVAVKSNQQPVVLTQPVDQVANLGSVAFFTVSISGFPDPVYQWRKDSNNLANGGNISGANKPTLAVSNISAADLATYSVVVSNSLGSIASNGAKLMLNGAPVFTSQPASSQVVSSGAVVQLAVTVAGDPVPTLQWRKDGANLTNGGIVSGATGTALTLTGVTEANAGSYSVVATNSHGSVTSGSFAVSILASNVWNQSVTTGKDVALSATNVSGNVQWQASSNSGTTWSNLANDSTYGGVTTGTLNIADVTAALNNVLFRLVTVTNGETVVLHSARLNVTSAFVPFPVSLAADGSGNLYVADASSDTIEKINVSSQIAPLAGTAGQTGTADGSGTAARFNDPSGVAAASDGTLAIADRANGTIRLITPAGAVTTLAGSTTLRGNVDGNGAAATFSSPLGITRDSSGNLYVADAMNHTIRKVTPAGVVSTLAGTAGQAGTSDGTGNAARFNSPSGIDVDSGGNLFVADTTNNLIRKISPTGTVTTLAGLAGVSGTSDGAGLNALFNQPNGLAVDNSGNVYVADTGSSTVRRVSSAGVVITVAGLPGIAGHKDGAGVEAWFNQPRDVAVSPAGFLYVADTGNASIRRIDQTGTVTTVALTAPVVTDPNPTNPLPNPPTLPTTPTLPTLPTSPTPPSTGGGGGGGGAPSYWFFGALAALLALRRATRSTD